MAENLTDKQILARRDAQRDMSFCGYSLAADEATRFSDEGAHDPTATYYFVLEELFPKLGLTVCSHLLDVGCGAGRALANFASSGYPGCATGVELDPRLARRALAWTKDFLNIDIVQDSVLNLDLHSFTHFYLFNPFDTPVLMQFLEKLEHDHAGQHDRDQLDPLSQHDHAGQHDRDQQDPLSQHENEPGKAEPVIVCHMSDNGENYWYLGRPGWKLREEGSFQYHDGLRAYDHPQHWSIWEFTPQGL